MQWALKPIVEQDLLRASKKIRFNITHSNLNEATLIHLYESEVRDLLKTIVPNGATVQINQNTVDIQYLDENQKPYTIIEVKPTPDQVTEGLNQLYRYAQNSNAVYVGLWVFDKMWYWKRKRFLEIVFSYKSLSFLQATKKPKIQEPFFPEKNDIKQFF